MAVIFFIYGLAFFLLGWTILVYPKEHSSFALRHALPYLAAFALLHGINEWCDMAFYIIAPARPHWLTVLRFLLLPISFVCLLFFGLQGVAGQNSRAALFRWPALALITLWGILTVASTNPFLEGDIWARYLLALPATLLAALALAKQLPLIEPFQLVAVRRALRLSAATFLVYGLLAGLIVPEGAFFPASAINYPVFYTCTGIPVQLLRALCALALAYSFLQVFKFFDLEANRNQEMAKDLANIVKHSLSEIYIFDAETLACLQANRSALENLGYTLEEMLTLTPLDLHQGATRDSFSELVAPLRSGLKKKIEVNVIQQRKDGSSYPASVYMWPSTYSSTPVFVAFVRDLTERQQTEEAIRRATNQLSILVASLPVVPFACEADGGYRITYVSGAIQEVTGYQPELFVEHPSFWLEHIHPSDRNVVFSPKLAPSEGDPTRLEYRFQVADGSFRWFSDTRRLVPASTEGRWQIVGIWQDITAEKRLQQESEVRLQQLIQADKLAALGEVVAGVAHEINNPVSFITYNLPLLAETWRMFQPIIEEYGARHPAAQLAGCEIGQLCREMDEMIEAIHIGAERIQKVVVNLKDFARMDEGVYKSAVQMNEVIQKALTIVGAQVRKQVTQVKLDLAADLPTIEGHPQKLEQVVINLVLNAALAVPKKEDGRLTIRSRYLAWLKAVLVEVEDNGIGIPPEDLERIFDPFFSTRRTKGGTGLGLSVSYGLIQEHRGRIGVLSRHGIGSNFSLFLPLRQEQEELKLSPTLLCVDDDPEVLSVLSTFFVKVHKMPFATISEPESVMQYLADHPEVDIVLSDICMPGIDGWALLTRIKKSFPLKTVFLTSGSEEALHRRPPGAPAPDALLPKPFDIQGLVHTIQHTGRQRL